VLRSKPFRALVKGRDWNDFEKVMKDAAKDPQKVTSPKKVAR